MEDESVILLQDLIWNAFSFRRLRNRRPFSTPGTSPLPGILKNLCASTEIPHAVYWGPAEDEHCCLTAWLDATRPPSHWAKQRGVMWCSWMGLVRYASGWRVAETPKRSHFIDASFSQLDAGRGRAAPPHTHRWFPTYHFLWWHPCKRKGGQDCDPPGSLQGGPCLINWQRVATRSRGWVTIVCFGHTALSPQLLTHHLTIQQPHIVKLVK